MKDECKKFYGNALIGTWIVPSTGKRIIPQLSYGKQRMIWSGRPSIDAFGGYEWDEVDGIEWVKDDEMNHLIPFYNGEKLEYDEAM
jgi:hypothetical protein|tara:strand:- start:901 stop:1158 length:258 start_codon:yes stop_codon:yes gene_type:complete